MNEIDGSPAVSLRGKFEITLADDRVVSVDVEELDLRTANEPGSFSMLIFGIDHDLSHNGLLLKPTSPAYVTVQARLAGVRRDGPLFTFTIPKLEEET